MAKILYIYIYYKGWTFPLPPPGCTLASHRTVVCTSGWTLKARLSKAGSQSRPWAVLSRSIGFWAVLSLEDATAALSEGGGATARTAPEVSANNPAAMILSLEQFWASCSMLRALQGARRLLKLVYQFHIVFFCSYRRLPLTPPPGPPLR